MEQQGTDLATGQSSTLRRQQMALSLPWDQLSAFFPLLQRGVALPARLGSPLKELLCQQFAIPEDYVAGRITTIFLDNRPVDDLERSLVHQGSRVTLSAAMPGLVGATMRRSGFYASLRQGISHAEPGGESEAGEGTIRLKLFNLLLPELGPVILGRGILLRPAELAGLSGARLGWGRFAAALSRLDQEREILLTVSFGAGDE